MLDADAIRKCYRRYARFYDVYFGPVLHPGRRTLMREMQPAPGQRVLEVGVGTGLSLPMYPESVQITGVDVSPEMVEQARQRAARDELENVDLHVMDAKETPFEDDAFDCVVAMYTVSCVPNPVALLDEMRRVCRPDGDLFILNHFRHPNTVMGRVEKTLAPLSRYLGFRPDLDLDRLVQQAQLDVVEVMPANLFGYWTLVRARPAAREAAA